MKKMLALLAFTLVIFAYSAEQASAAPSISAGLQKKINIAVEKGVEWLLNKQTSNGSWDPGSNPTYSGGTRAGSPDARFGVTALSTLALLESDVPPDHKAIQSAMRYLVDHIKDSGVTYQHACFLMAAHSFVQHQLDAFEAEKDAKKKKKPGKKPKKKKKKKKNPARYERFIQQFLGLKAAIAAAATKTKDLAFADGSWRYTTNADSSKYAGADKGDISSTQFALLGLHAADEMGNKISPNIFWKAAIWVYKAQEATGPKVTRKEGAAPSGSDGESSYVAGEQDFARGWAYQKGSTHEGDGIVNGGMTTVGVCSLIVAKAHLRGHKGYKKMKKKYNQAIYDGVGWLSDNWSVKKNPKGRRSYMYYMYGIERVAMLGGFDYIAGHHWYEEGAEALIPRQKGDGHWMAINEINPKDIIGTCFALLFLKKGTAAIASGRPQR